MINIVSVPSYKELVNDFEKIMNNNDKWIKLYNINLSLSSISSKNKTIYNNNNNNNNNMKRKIRLNERQLNDMVGRVVESVLKEVKMVNEIGTKTYRRGLSALNKKTDDPFKSSLRTDDMKDKFRKDLINKYRKDMEEYCTKKLKEQLNHGEKRLVVTFSNGKEVDITLESVYINFSDKDIDVDNITLELIFNGGDVVLYLQVNKDGTFDLNDYGRPIRLNNRQFLRTAVNLGLEIINDFNAKKEESSNSSFLKLPSKFPF